MSNPLHKNPCPRVMKLNSRHILCHDYFVLNLSNLVKIGPVVLEKKKLMNNDGLQVTQVSTDVKDGATKSVIPHRIMIYISSSCITIHN